MKKYIINNLSRLILFFLLVLFAGCFAVNESTVSKGMQNLSARYNYIHNSNVLLDKYNEEQLNIYVDNYEKILPVYLDPEPQENITLTSGIDHVDLDNIIKKGHTIINDKAYSNYIDDAYMLLGKAHYFKGNYFIASEYFNYVSSTYKNDTKNYVMALNWEARTLMTLNNMSSANSKIDTLIKASIGLKREIDEPLATIAQMRIYEQKYYEAIDLLTRAIRISNQKQLRIRWQFILAQLQAQVNDFQNSFITFTKVENSNAPFAMYFQANLNRIKLRSLISGYKIDQEKQLLALIKDDKNAGYIDHIYYQVGELFKEEGNYEKAELYYLKSVNEPSNNNNQKAVSYLRIADLNFKNFNNYVKAKAYYDSAAVSLPKNYPDYESIVKKSENLKFLTDRYSLIATEDTLQTIAKLPIELHNDKISNWLKPKKTVEPNKTVVNSALAISSNNNINQNTSNNSNANFYFNNAQAISTGFGDFKRKWGNRTLEDNWRQSLKTAQQDSQASLSEDLIANQTIFDPNNAPLLDDEAQLELEEKFISLIPTTPELVNISNNKILDAYFQMGNFYQYELNDKIEAEKIYEIILNRFPENKYLDAIYYSMYLLNKDTDTFKSNDFKNLVLNKFPQSNFSKTILDPSYTVKQDVIENQILQNYNTIYNIFEAKNYSNTINEIEHTLNNFPENKLAAQYAYIKAISIGRTQPVEALISELNQIVSKHPTDSLITPLVKEHLEFINKNIADFNQRTVALHDFNPENKNFIESKVETFVAAKKLTTTQNSTLNGINVVVKSTSLNEIKLNNKINIAEEKKINPEIDSLKTINLEIPVAKTEVSNITTNAITGVKTDGVFTNAISNEYYYVINVKDVSSRLSSSRFGIGQFNRGNFRDNELVHKLIELDENQLIYINSFVDLEDALLYEKTIFPQLKNIMKVQENLYFGFIISKENFEKITDRKHIEQYLEFYKNSY